MCDAFQVDYRIDLLADRGSEVAKLGHNYTGRMRPNGATTAMRHESTYNPAMLARRIRALAEKRIDQASATPDMGSRQTLEEVASAYHALANVVARQADLRKMPGLSVPQANTDPN